MFRQIAPNGIVNKVDRSSQLHGDEIDEHDHEHAAPAVATHEEMSKAVQAACPFLGGQSQQPSKTEYIENVVTASGSTTEEKLAAQEKGELAPGNAVVVPAGTHEEVATHEEMSKITPGEVPVLMNKEGSVPGQSSV